jgi:hypothetical protein
LIARARSAPQPPPIPRTRCRELPLWRGKSPYQSFRARTRRVDHSKGATSEHCHCNRGFRDFAKRPLLVVQALEPRQPRLVAKPLYVRGWAPATVGVGRHHPHSGLRPRLPGQDLIWSTRVFMSK